MEARSILAARTSSGGGSASGGSAANGGSASKGGTTGSAGASMGGTTTTGTTPVTVWIAGDSTVATGGSTCPYGWGGKFASYFNTSVTVKNNAAGGRSIQTWMYEPNVSTTMGSNGECVVTETNSARWATTLSGMKAGDYLFIQFGINDGSATCDRHVGSARYQALMTRMAQAALDRGAHPIVLTAVGMIKCSGSTAVASRGFLTETKAVATALKIPVIDLHQLSTALYNTLKFCPLPAGNTDISATTGGAVGAFFCDDHTHFDQTGATQIAAVVAKALRDQSIPLAAYLK
ncbi:MAG: GDSL-type esterase/lipase family protein [Polyangiaceae bacterium]